MQHTLNVSKFLTESVTFRHVSVLLRRENFEVSS